LLCSGCASVVSVFTGFKAKVAINSNPSGATVTVTGDNGMVIVTNTPAVVQLHRAKGYFAPAHYGVKLEMAGYQPFETAIHPVLNPWYIGNILVGGIPGFVAVDPLTGAMWWQHPHTIDVNLVPLSGSPTSFVPEQQNAVVAAANPPPNSESASTPKETPK
jgi:DNA-binding beta-propeller fold protein YncE